MRKTGNANDYSKPCVVRSAMCNQETLWSGEQKFTIKNCLEILINLSSIPSAEIKKEKHCFMHFEWSTIQTNRSSNHAITCYFAPINQFDTQLFFELWNRCLSFCFNRTILNRSISIEFWHVNKMTVIICRYDRWSITQQYLLQAKGVITQQNTHIHINLSNIFQKTQHIKPNFNQLNHTT